MLSSSTRSAPAPTASGRSSSESHSTSTGRSGYAARTARERRGHAAGGDHVVVLDQRGVRQRHPVVGAAAAAHRVLLQRAQARQSSCGCPGRSRRCRRPRRPSGRSAVATPERWQSRFSAVRSADSSARVGPVTVPSTSPRRDPVAVRRGPRSARRRPPRRRRRRPPGGRRARRPRGPPGRRWRPGPPGRSPGGDVDAAGPRRRRQVLGQRPPHEVEHGRRIQPRADEVPVRVVAHRRLSSADLDVTDPDTPRKPSVRSRSAGASAEGGGVAW